VARPVRGFMGKGSELSAHYGPKGHSISRLLTGVRKTHTRHEGLAKRKP
jgi:hypothetical protein